MIANYSINLLNLLIHQQFIIDAWGQVLQLQSRNFWLDHHRSKFLKFQDKKLKYFLFFQVLHIRLKII